MTGHNPATGDRRAGLAALLQQVIRRFLCKATTMGTTGDNWCRKDGGSQNLPD
jgi:hypothetical protein